MCIILGKNVTNTKNRYKKSMFLLVKGKVGNAIGRHSHERVRSMCIHPAPCNCILVVFFRMYDQRGGVYVCMYVRILGIRGYVGRIHSDSEQRG